MGILDSFRNKSPDRKSGQVNPQAPLKAHRATARGWQVGERIDNRYEIRQILGGPGKSGMGIVYVCYDHEHKTPVALKTLQDRFLSNRAAVDRFKWEAETWTRLEKHYNIVRAIFVSMIDDRPYISMEYIAGDTQYGPDLSDWIWGGGLRRNGRPDVNLILDFSLQFCHGMIHAKKKFEEMGKPFVHRDVKPSNIMVTSDRVVKITDFGLVKAFAESLQDIPSTMVEDRGCQKPSLSKSGGICGTPPYMSPEQCRGDKQIDERSDVYSFGCVLYEMITGRYVFQARTPEEFIRYHLKAVPPSPNSHGEMDKVVLKCLEKEPRNRYQGFHELEHILAEFYLALTGEVVRPPEGVLLEAWELSNKGVSLANLGFSDEAITCYREALRINPNVAQPHNNLGRAYSDKGDLDAAMREYQEALRINPGYPEARHGLGNAYLDMGQTDSAIREYREVLRTNPNFVAAHFNLANVYKAKGELDMAISEYQDALRINPKLANAHLNLGNVYKAKGEMNAAIGEYREALKTNPNYAEAHTNLGITYTAKGQPDAAIAEYEESVRINPNDVDAHFRLGFAYDRRGNQDAAIREYQECVRIHPNYVLAHYTLGLAYHHKGESRKAVEYYQSFVRLATPGEASLVERSEAAIRELKRKS